MSMLPSKVMPYLLRLAAPLMDSSIVQWKFVDHVDWSLNKCLQTFALFNYFIMIWSFFCIFFCNLLYRNILMHFSFSFNSLSAFLTFLLDTFLFDEWNSNQYINVIDSLLLKVWNFFTTYLFLLQGVPVFRNFSIRGPAILWFISDTYFVNCHYVFFQFSISWKPAVTHWTIVWFLFVFCHLM